MSYPERIYVFNRVLKKKEAATYKGEKFGMLIYAGEESGALYYIRKDLVGAYLTP
jgi:hypothetical protein